MDNKAENVNKSLSFNGDHHQNTIEVDSTGKISLAMIRDFSDNAGAQVKIDSDGHVSGSIYNSGDTHSLSIDLYKDGTFDGTYEDKNGGIKIDMEGGIANLVSGHIPETGITVSGEHHIIKLKLSEEGQISGSLESRNVDNGAYKISIDNGVMTGSITCSGDSHKTTIQVASDGTWKASFSMQNDSSKLTISAEEGIAGVTAKVGVSVSF